MRLMTEGAGSVGWLEWCSAEAVQLLGDGAVVLYRQECGIHTVVS